MDAGLEHFHRLQLSDFNKRSGGGPLVAGLAAKRPSQIRVRAQAEIGEFCARPAG
jgi:hypothetical protein